LNAAWRVADARSRSFMAEHEKNDDAAGLTPAELQHFAERGWVIRPGVFSAEECTALRVATDFEISHARQQEDHEKLLGVVANADESDGAHYGRLVVKGIVDTVAGAATVKRPSAFSMWAAHPKIQPALVQLLGSEPQFTGSMILVTPPHPRRNDPAMREVLRDNNEMVWHRGIRPKWGVRQAEGDSGHINTSWLHTCTFLSDAWTADDGGTLVLSGSHRMDVESSDGDPPPPANDLGRAGRVANQVPDWSAALLRREQACGPQGTVMHFSESLIHSGLAVLSERTRYAMFVDCTPSAIATGDVAIDTRVGYRPDCVQHPWDLRGQEMQFDNPIVHVAAFHCSTEIAQLLPHDDKAVEVGGRPKPKL
jgi:hypothetical protein